MKEESLSESLSTFVNIINLKKILKMIYLFYSNLSKKILYLIKAIFVVSKSINSCRNFIVGKIKS